MKTYSGNKQKNKKFFKNPLTKIKECFILIIDKGQGNCPKRRKK